MRFIVFEGNEGTGKTTLIKRLRQQFPERDNLVYTWEQGSSFDLKAQELREWIFDSPKDPWTMQFASITSRLKQWVGIEKKFPEDTTFLVDRSYISGKVYFHLDMERLNLHLQIVAMNQMVDTLLQDGIIPTPDVLIHTCAPVDTILERIKAKNDKKAYDNLPLDQIRKLNELYWYYTGKEALRIKETLSVFTAEQTEEECYAILLSRIQSYLVE